MFAWFRFVRFSRSTALTAVRLLGIAVLVAGAGNAAAWSAVTRYRDFGADAPDLRLGAPRIGVGDRFVFADAVRGDPDGSEEDYLVESNGTDTVPWKIDLETGAWERCGGPREEWSEPSTFSPWQRASVALLFVDDDDEDSLTGTWFDARTGERMTRGTSDRLPPGGDARALAALQDSSSVRDRQGRKAWLWNGQLHREGLPPMSLDLGTDWWREIPGGWAKYGRTWHGPGSSATVTTLGLRTIEADTGRIRQHSSNVTDHRGYVVDWWDPAHALVVEPTMVFTSLQGNQSEMVTPVWMQPPQSLPLAQHRLFALDTGRVEPLVEKDSDLAAAVPLAHTGDRRLLLAIGEPKAQHVASWMVGDPVAVPATWDGGALEGPVDGIEAVGEGRGPPSMARVGQPVLLSAFRAGPGGPIRPFHPLSLSPARSLEAWLLYVPASNRVRIIKPWSRALRDGPLRLLPDGAVIALEAGRRIVRLGPEARQRTVLFPR